MTLNLNVPETQANLMPRITVIGVGGAGGNAVNNMILANLEGVEFMIANTDAQAIQQSMCQRRIQLGRNVTQGLGSGSRPDIGRAAAEEALDDTIKKFVRRFQAIEKKIHEEGKQLTDCDLAELDAIWNEIKKGE